MERGAYTEAAQHYRQAMEHKPRSESIRAKYDQAEEQVLRNGMAAAERALEDGNLEAAQEIGLETTWYLRTTRRINEFEALLREPVREQAVGLRGEGSYSTALWYLDRHFEAFGEPKDDLWELRESIVEAWIDEVRGLAVVDREADRYAAAALREAVAGWLEENRREDPNALEDARRAQEMSGWRLDLSGNEDDGQIRALRRGALESMGGLAIRGIGEETEGFLASLHFILEEPTFEQWEERTQRSEEYQSGTRLVENPAYAEAYRRWEEAEVSVREAERRLDQAWREVRDAELELERRQRQGRTTSLAEGRVDRAYRDVRDWERELDRRIELAERNSMEARRIPTHLEEPVISEHFYEVALQRSRMTASVRLQLTVPEIGLEEVLETEIVGTRTTERHSPQPVLNLRGKSQPAPGREEARAELLGALEVEIALFVTESFRDYREELLASSADFEEAARLDAIVLYFLLDPVDRSPELEAEANSLVGFDDALGLLLRMIEET